MQFAFNALARLSAVSHGVANVVNRVVVILASGEAAAPPVAAGRAGPLFIFWQGCSAPAQPFTL